MEKCRFSHPPLCRPYMDYGLGPGGCKEGKKCSKKHPEICETSLKKKKCQNMGNGSKCRNGYHLKDTKPVSQERTEVPSSTSETSESAQNSTITINQNQLMGFLGKLVREELMSALTTLMRNNTTGNQQLPQQQMPPQQQNVAQQMAQPQQPPVISQQPVYLGSQDYLSALLKFPSRS